MKATMVLLCVLWGVFAFLFYRGIYARYVRHKDYADFAKATYQSVQAHFTELKDKSRKLVVDKGFNIKDDSAWTEALETFVSSVVAPALKPATLHRIKTSPAISKDFSTLAINFTLELIAHERMPSGYDLQTVIKNIEVTGDVMAFFSGTPKYLPGKEVRTRLAVMLIAVGLFAISDQSYATNGEPFSPLAACNALIDEDGFLPNASGYTELYDGVYSCATPYKDLGSEALPNNVALYGKGTASEVTRVKLMLNVNVASKVAQDTRTLAKLCTKMIASVSGESPQGLEKQIAQGKPFEQQYQGYRLFLTKTVWSTGKGFELNCGIATNDNKE